MRLLLIFILSLITFFFLGELLNRLFKRPYHSIPGIVMMAGGLLIGLLGKFFIAPPLDLIIGYFFLGSGLGLTIHHLLSQRYIISEKRETGFVKRHESLFERFFEVLPGLLTWVALTSPFWMSLTMPFAVAYFILIAQIYWLFSSLKIATLILVGYRKMVEAKKQPWLEKLKKDFPGEWDKYYHILLLPTYNENSYIIRPSVEAVVNSNYPKEKVFMVVGQEERVQKKNPQLLKEVQESLKQYKNKLAGLFTPLHPTGLEGEIPGPGTNRNWMVKTAVEELKKRGIDPKYVIATTLDADFVIHPEFLAAALHKYLSTPKTKRDKRSYTGVFFYHNNYWQAPTPMRLIANGTSLWQLAEMVGSDKYQNYSSMSINLQSLLDIGGWIPNKVNDDSGFYWKAYFHFKGDYAVIPHYMPITADTVLDETLPKTFINQYQQLKRWAYGVEHIPFIFKEYFKSKDIDFWDKTDKLIFVMWANLRWGFLALFVTFAGLIIPYINPEYNTSVVAVNLPIISSYILTFAFLGLFVTIYVHEKTAPKRPSEWNLIQRIWSYMQLLLVPLVLVSISTIPAIDAQTSLMFGRYIEYRTTNKARLIT